MFASRNPVLRYRPLKSRGYRDSKGNVAPVRRLTATERAVDVARAFRDDQFVINCEMVERCTHGYSFVSPISGIDGRVLRLTLPLPRIPSRKEPPEDYTDARHGPVDQYDDAISNDPEYNRKAWDQMYDKDSFGGEPTR